jgi:hypothetical protein
MSRQTPAIQVILFAIRRIVEFALYSILTMSLFASPHVLERACSSTLQEVQNKHCTIQFHQRASPEQWKVLIRC